MQWEDRSLQHWVASRFAALASEMALPHSTRRLNCERLHQHEKALRSNSSSRKESTCFTCRMARTRRRARRNIHSRCRYGGDAAVAGAAPPERSRLATAWARWKAGASDCTGPSGPPSSSVATSTAAASWHSSLRSRQGSLLLSAKRTEPGRSGLVAATGGVATCRFPVPHLRGGGV